MELRVNSTARHEHTARTVKGLPRPDADLGRPERYVCSGNAKWRKYCGKSRSGVLNKIKHTFYDLANPTPGYFPNRNYNLCPPRNMPRVVHGRVL